jgi:hypothetical protein
LPWCVQLSCTTRSLPWPHRSNGAKWPWTETSETVSWNKSFFLWIDFLKHFVTVVQSWLTQWHYRNYLISVHVSHMQFEEYLFSSLLGHDEEQMR